ncbi:MAG: hypothetical protein IJ901_10585 [Bacteroidaceae bacterium]|nr:hypothetical protein [Bacteroidaceae bacterium]
MVFSKEKWDGEDGIGMFVHASKALSWETMAGPLQQAWLLYVVPLLGEVLCDAVSSVFVKDAAARSAEEKRVLWYVQSAVANLALWHSFRELNTRLTDQGHQRQETENFKSVYKYQERELCQSYRNKGFNGLDGLLAYLDGHVDAFPAWSDAPANVRRKRAVVKSTEEVNNVVFINGSTIVFLRLVPILRKLEETELPVILGRRLCDEFLEKLGRGRCGTATDGAERTGEAGEDAEDGRIGETTVEELRVRVGRVLINKAVAELIRQTGSLTDRGLYFETVTAGGEGDEIRSPQLMGEAVQHAAVYERDALAQYQVLSNFIETCIPDLYAGHPSDLFRRDNDSKRTMWV